MVKSMYFMQIESFDMEVFGVVANSRQVVERVDMMDCSDEAIDVYDISEFGKIKPIRVKMVYGGGYTDEDSYVTYVCYVGEDEDGNELFREYVEEH